ncbi:BTAD domain-containing putative transcriptional regulator [Amycolatopsis sp. EV170708-02-1]|uniref:AfsR/SARP family transcriptional regulator n=1 Tax=Amycolatopsis sp. EV170708-02-1 TaxID=2919322 RepID=UPI001F0B837B|nr:BTAD domain-containing putative transcriptional regulator [Amycolatopsis sp. EV170708-02-1]UMP07540.1 tetratricopeptide repeat protein [Amycolatopsis sp. EV170708-02-1]
MGVLGPVEVVADGVRFDVGHARQRDVLAVLLLDVARVVPVDVLINRVWGERPPTQPRNALYGYVSRLRRALAALDGVTIERDRGGYVLLTDPQTVDTYYFESLLGRARTTVDDDAALALYEEALGLWRGRPLGELESAWADSVRLEMEYKREAAVLERNDLRLRTGAHTAVLTEPPPDGMAGERAAAQRIEALYLDGRPADALREYETFRSHLADEFGADPGPRLRGLHQRILIGTVQDGERPAPRQLPRAPRSFAGRADELTMLDRALAARGAIAVISGAGGLGKTWLAVRWATDHVSRFPDGQLYVDLRGFDSALEPVPAVSALRGFVSALGVAGTSIPSEPDALAALYRSLTAQRRLLVLLDNARDTDQVIPLLPGGSSCSVLVTSRHELGGLLTTHGASALPLRALDEIQARELLMRKVGAVSLAEEPEAAREIVRLCGGLSLALAIAGARIVAQPGRRLSAVAAELRESRLDALDTGELSASVRAVFSASYRSLDLRCASAFRLLGLWPDGDIDGAAATALFADARPLRALCAANLLEEDPPGRFRMHDLVKLYAAELLADTDSPDARLAASTRLFDHYLSWASAVMDLMSPNEPYLRPPTTHSAGPQPHFADHDEARAWLDTERATMLTLAERAKEIDLSRHVVRLSAILWRYLYVGAHYQEALTLHTTALALTPPGTTDHGFAGQAVGMALFRLGRYDDAAGHFEQALSIAIDRRNALLESMVRNGLASVDDMRGRRKTARKQYMLALTAARRTGHALLEGIALCNLGEHYSWCGHYQTAIGFLEQSGRIAEDLDSAGLGGPVLAALGSAYAGLGQSHKAAQHFQRALKFARAGRDTNLEVATLNEFAATKAGAEAITLYEDALLLAHRIGHLHERAKAHHGIGKTHLGSGNYSEARPHLEAALAAYSELDAPEAHDVRALLSTRRR